MSLHLRAATGSRRGQQVDSNSSWNPNAMRVGGIILVPTILLWFPAGFPSPPPSATGSPIEYNLAGMLGRALAVTFQEAIDQSLPWPR